MKTFASVLFFMLSVASALAMEWENGRRGYGVEDRRFSPEFFRRNGQASSGWLHDNLTQLKIPVFIGRPWRRGEIVRMTFTVPVTRQNTTLLRNIEPSWFCTYFLRRHTEGWNRTLRTAHQMYIVEMNCGTPGSRLPWERRN